MINRNNVILIKFIAFLNLYLFYFYLNLEHYFFLQYGGNKSCRIILSSISKWGFDRPYIYLVGFNSLFYGGMKNLKVTLDNDLYLFI